MQNITLQKVIEKSFKRAKARATKKNLPFGITKKYLLKLYKRQDGYCYYTGRFMAFSKKECADDCISLDRVQPKKGYVKGNLVYCTIAANSMKGKRPVQDFLKMCSDIHLNSLAPRL